MEYHSEKTTCAAAELAHHADEIVEYRLMAGVLGLLALVAHLVARSRSDLTDGEARGQRRRFLSLATAAFGLGAVILLSTGTSVQFGSGESAPRWFTDGAVSFAFFLFSASMLARTHRP
jgi:hypothetical protein